MLFGDFKIYLMEYLTNNINNKQVVKDIALYEIIYLWNDIWLYIVSIIKVCDIDYDEPPSNLYLRITCS